ncbi:MAG: hypothetical protein OXH94_06730, partial [Rhodospirillales bacterium]|nr:hypothetical protein [Rhodospirillales bacterium]
MQLLQSRDDSQTARIIEFFGYIPGNGNDNQKERESTMNALSKDAPIHADRLSLPGLPAPRLDPDSARDYARYRHLSNGLRLTIDDIKRFAAGVADGIRFILERNAERRMA